MVLATPGGYRGDHRTATLAVLWCRGGRRLAEGRDLGDNRVAPRKTRRFRELPRRLLRGPLDGLVLAPPGGGDDFVRLRVLRRQGTISMMSMRCHELYFKPR